MKEAAKPYRRMLAGLALLAATATAGAQDAAGEYVEGSIYFKLRDEVLLHVKDDRGAVSLNDLPFLTALRGQFGITRVRRSFYAAASAVLRRTYRLDFGNHAAADELIAALLATGLVEYAEKVPLPSVTYAPNDPGFADSQWYLARINASGAWDYSRGDKGVKLAVVDVAIAINHPDLAANIWVNPGEIPGNNIDDDNNGYIDDVNGWDVGDNDNDPSPPNTSFNHGTHVAGDAGAVGDNGTGISSIGFGISIIAVKAQSDGGSSGGLSAGYEGVTYAADAGADIINMSWGGTAFSQTGQNVVDYAISKGCIMVGGAGNSNVETQFYPAAFPGVISVAASDEQDRKASFSSYGTWVDITAPGNNIYSTMPFSGYELMSGTSMATPIVSGLCALMLSVNPALTPADVESCLKSSAADIYPLNPSYAGKLGAGRIDAAAAMACAAAALSMPPVALFTADRTDVCTPAGIQFTDRSTFAPTDWLWDFGDGTTSGLANPLHSYAANGSYTVTLTASNANGSDSEVKTSFINVNLPADPVVTGDQRCGPGTVNLAATGSYTLNWYDSPSGGTAVNTGSTFSPNISATTTFYVADEDIQPVQKVGEPNNSKTGGYLNTTDRKLIFDVMDEVIIRSVVLYANGAGNRIIEVWNSAAEVVASRPVSVLSAGMHRVTLDFTFPPGDAYAMKLAANSPYTGLYRNNAGGLSYPYVVNDLVTIRTTDASGAGIVPTNYYYYFYDWEVQGAPCVSGRAPVTGTVEVCSGAEYASGANDIVLFPNPAGDVVYARGGGIAAVTSGKIVTLAGQAVWEWEDAAAGSFPAAIDLSGLPSGVYILALETEGATHHIRLIKN